MPKVRCKQNPPINANIPSTFSGDKKPRPEGSLPAESEAGAMMLFFKSLHGCSASLKNQKKIECIKIPDDVELLKYHSMVRGFLMKLKLLSMISFQDESTCNSAVGENIFFLNPGSGQLS